MSQPIDPAKTVPGQPGHPGHLVWMDMEMSGLSPERDLILEIATVITDKDLNILAEGPELVIQQEPQLFETMDAWNREHHTKSGLWKQVLASKTTLDQAHEATFAFVRSQVGEKTSPLCGNSIWQDRRFLARYMPKLESYLHYRILDVSSIKELLVRWYPDTHKFKKKDSNHRAKEDILQSIEELKYYRATIFQPHGKASP